MEVLGPSVNPPNVTVSIGGDVPAVISHPALPQYGPCTRQRQYTGRLSHSDGGVLSFAHRSPENIALFRWDFRLLTAPWE